MQSVLNRDDDGEGRDNIVCEEKSCCCTGGVGGWMFCSPEAVGWIFYEGCPMCAGGLGTSTATMSRLRALSSNEDELSKECPK